MNSQLGAAHVLMEVTLVLLQNVMSSSAENAGIMHRMIGTIQSIVVTLHIEEVISCVCNSAAETMCITVVS